MRGDFGSELLCFEFSYLNLILFLTGLDDVEKCSWIVSLLKISIIVNIRTDELSLQVEIYS